MDVLLPYQQRWCADTSRVRVCEKSRRVGLSWSEAGDSALEASRKGGQDTWYIGYNKDMALEFIRDCAEWAKNFQLAAEAMEEIAIEDEDRDILAFRIQFASGARVTALSSRPANLRGKQGRVIIDEAAFHDNLAELLKAALALLIWGGSVSVISTHNGVDNPFNELVQEVREGRKPYSLHRITFDDAVKEGLCKRVFLATDKPWSTEAEAKWCNEIRTLYRPNDAEELDCIPASSGGAYLSSALIESRMSAGTPILRFTCKEGFEQLGDDVREKAALDWLEADVAPVLEKLPQAVSSSFGHDFGRTGDLSVFAPLLELQALQRVCPFIIELGNVPFKQQEQILFWVVDRLPRFSFGALDARGNGQYLAEVAMQKYGAASIAQVMLTNTWYLENMPRFKAALEDGTLDQLPKDADVKSDLRMIVMNKGIPKLAENARTKSATGQQRHGDAAIAFALAWYASEQDGGSMECIEVPRRARDQTGRDFMRDDQRDDLPQHAGRGDW
ncbi:terminase family protein [Paraburkholderia sp. BR14263]|uniref:terminase large subunit domain-containing protein n=1 Tax=unclassified Paraburkholderia TaxID=2615204 RepID=UPI0034CE05BC